jgi:ABC-type phosphate transport system permease subunit
MFKHIQFDIIRITKLSMAAMPSIVDTLYKRRFFLGAFGTEFSALSGSLKPSLRRLPARTVFTLSVSESGAMLQCKRQSYQEKR